MWANGARLVYRCAGDGPVSVIIENGLAGQMTIEPNSTFSSLFGAAAAEANRAGLGLWRACDGPDDLVDS